MKFSNPELCLKIEQNFHKNFGMKYNNAQLTSQFLIAEPQNDI